MEIDKEIIRSGLLTRCNLAVAGCLYSFVLLTLLGSCSPKFNKTVSPNYNVDCDLLNVDFEIETKGFRVVEDELNDFLNSTYSYDILIVEIEGGSDNFIVKRWFVDEFGTKLKMLTITPTTKNEQSRVLSNNFLNRIENIEEGGFLQICQYTSRRYSNLIMVKQESLLKFKYSSSNVNYTFLNQSDKNKIAYTIELIGYLNKKFEVSRI
jgi:hypothetical protein